MAVTKCPVCNGFLVGYKWEKTKTGKNWIKHPEKGWHDCPNKKFKKKTAGQNQKLTLTDFGPMVRNANGWRREKIEGGKQHDANTLYYNDNEHYWYSQYRDQAGKKIIYTADELDQAREDGFTDIQEDWRAKE